MAKDENIIILGAGLAGLSAAFRLKKGFRLLESLKIPGGLCVTQEKDGFRFDKTGHLLHLSKPKIRKTILALLDDQPLELERKSRIFSHKVYTRYPFQANTHGLPETVIAECLTGFIRARASNKSNEINTFEDFIYRHFGEGIAKHFMIPYNSKLWGVHPSMITSAWCHRFVPLPSIDEVVKGAIGSPKKEMGYNARFLYPKSGIQELSLALARKVSKIEYSTTPRAIDPKRRRIHINGEWVNYKSLVTTIPLTNLVNLLVDVPKNIPVACSKLRCSSLRYLDVALSSKAGNEYHWTYVPEKKYPFYRVGCYSNFSSQMAPRGKSNLYVELSSRGRVNLSRVLPRVSDGLLEMGLIKRPDQIEFAIPRYIEKAYVIYDKDREIVVPKLLGWLEQHGILSAGRYARWEYSSMEDSISQGFAAATRAKENK